MGTYTIAGFVCCCIVLNLLTGLLIGTIADKWGC